jgi:hypothetical protein
MFYVKRFSSPTSGERGKKALKAREIQPSIDMGGRREERRKKNNETNCHNFLQTAIDSSNKSQN